MTDIDVPGGVVTVPFEITQEQADRIREAFTAAREAPVDHRWLEFEPCRPSVARRLVNWLRMRHGGTR